MPAAPKAHPPQTTKKARREYLKSTKLYQFSPSQLRAAERREELEKRAEKCRAKEERKKDNKRKREEKEETAREAKRTALVEGKVPPESFLGKVRASQRRLNAFFVGPQKAKEESPGVEEEPQNPGHAHENHKMSESIQPLAHEMIPTRGRSTESILPRARPVQQNGDQQHRSRHEQTATSDIRHANSSNCHTVAAAQETPQSSEQAQLDAQLSFNSDADFDIAVDTDALQLLNELDKLETAEQGSSDMLPPIFTSPMKRKASSPYSPFASTAKSARSALAEMSPSKVNVRAQEKPDVTSAPPSSAFTPSPAKQQLSESAADIIKGIATQDLQDDEYATDKENQDPLQDRGSQQRQADKGLMISREKGSEKDLDHTSAERNKAALRSTRLEQDDYDLGDEFEFDLEDGEDEYDLDLDDETMAALAVPPQNTKRALSFMRKPETQAGQFSKLEAQGSTSSNVSDRLEHAKAVASMPKAMLPPPIVVASQNAHPDTPRPAAEDALSRYVSAPDFPATQGNSFSFDGVAEEDLLNLVVDGDQTPRNTRTIPWNNRPDVTLSQGTAEALTPDDERADD